MALRPWQLFALALALRPISSDAADGATAKAALESWTAFGGLGAVAPVDGVQLKTNSSMSFERGLSAQAIYVVDGTVEAAAGVLRSLDPTRFPQLEVFQQDSYQAETDARFGDLKIKAKAAPFQRLLKEMAEPKNLQLSPEEAARMPRHPDAASAQTFWAEVLRERATRFRREGTLVPAGGFDARSELRSLLGEEPKIAAHFSQLLQPWTSSEGNAGSLAAEHYWDVSNTEGLVNFELGAIFERPIGEARQLADVTYYSSSGYLASVSLFELIPFAGGPTPQTLVWHGTLVSSADAAGGYGLRRKFAIHTLETEMRQWIAIYRKLCAEAKK
jgi:hypothetical protein